MEGKKNILEEINRSLEPGWQARLTDGGRLYYLNHNDKTSHWAPPEVNWVCREALPYGWEVGLDKNGTPYYINHFNYSTSRDDPREDESLFLVERAVKLMRDPIMGFGFVAGSEKPVVVRSVTEGGPCDGKLFAGDEILKINNEDVKLLNRDYIINKVRSCQDFIYLTVAQPSMDKTSGRKSSLLSVSKKLKLKNNPSRVRFTEEVEENSGKMGKSDPSLLYLPSVLKVYLENHQTKSFKYDRKTTVRDVLSILQQKLRIKSMEYFSLLVQDMNSPSKSSLSFLQEHELLQKISARPNSHQWKCLFRISFVPKDAYDLLRTDPVAFDYLYTQCCNDVVGGKYGSELKYETAIRLAALQIQEHILSSKQTAKVSIKVVEKESGLERFLPESVLQGVKRKDVRRTINHYIKLNHNLTAPGQKHLTAMQAKLHYLKIVSELRIYGGRFFNATLISEDLKRSDVTLLVGPKNGISHVINMKNNVISLLADFSHVTSLNIYPTEDNQKRVRLNIEEMKSVQLIMLEDEAKDFACLVDGYYKLFVDKEKSLLSAFENKQLSSDPEAPVFFGKHKVQTAEWSYPTDLFSQLILGNEEVYLDNEDRPVPKLRKTQEGIHSVDFTLGSPPYQEDSDFLDSCMQMSLSHKEAGDGESTTDSHVEEIPITDITDNTRETPAKSTFSPPLPEVDYPRDDILKFDFGRNYDVSDAVATETMKSVSSPRGGIELLSYKYTSDEFGGWEKISDDDDEEMNRDEDEDDDEEEEEESNEESESDDSDCSWEDDSSSPRRHPLFSRDSLLLPRPKINLNFDALRESEIDVEDGEESIGNTSSDTDIIDLTVIPPPVSDNSDSIENVEMSLPPVDFKDDPSDVPVSVIDLPSAMMEGEAGIGSEIRDFILPPPVDVPTLQTSDEEHGAQLAAIDALEVEKKESSDAESDSGNETVSSETIDISNSNEQAECSHSPADFIKLLERNEDVSMSSSEQVKHSDYSDATYQSAFYSTATVDSNMTSIILPPPPESEFVDQDLLTVLIPPPLLPGDNNDVISPEDLPPPLSPHDNNDSIKDVPVVLPPPLEFDFRGDNSESTEFIPPPPLFDNCLDSQSEMKTENTFPDSEIIKSDKGHQVEIDREPDSPILIDSPVIISDSDSVTASSKKDSCTELPGFVTSANEDVSEPKEVDKKEPVKEKPPVVAPKPKKHGYVSPSFTRKFFSFDFSRKSKTEENVSQQSKTDNGISQQSKINNSIKVPSSPPLLIKSKRAFGSSDTLSIDEKKESKDDMDALPPVRRTSSLRWSFDSSRKSGNRSPLFQNSSLFYNPSAKSDSESSEKVSDSESSEKPRRPMLRSSTFGSLFSGITAGSKVSASASAPTTPTKSTSIDSQSPSTTPVKPPVPAKPANRGSPSVRTTLPFTRTALRPVSGQPVNTSGSSSSSSSEKKSGPLKAFKLCTGSTMREDFADRYERRSSVDSGSERSSPTPQKKQETLSDRPVLRRSISNPIFISTTSTENLSERKTPPASPSRPKDKPPPPPPPPPRRHSFGKPPAPPKPILPLSSPKKPKVPPPPPPTTSPLRMESPSQSLQKDISPPDTPPPLPATSPPHSPGHSLHSVILPLDDSDSDILPLDDSTEMLPGQSQMEGNSPRVTAAEIESREYNSEDAMERAQQDMAVLISDLDMMLDTVITSDEDLARKEDAETDSFNKHKQQLMDQAKDFATNAKMLVSSAAHSKEKLIQAVNRSMHTLARLFVECHNTMAIMNSHGQATHLATKVKDIANNFGETLKAAEGACGKSLSDPAMKLLLKEAQNMAAILSAMMRTLRMLQNR